MTAVLSDPAELRRGTAVKPANNVAVTTSAIAKYRMIGCLTISSPQ
jgi:hypothetical protein